MIPFRRSLLGVLLLVGALSAQAQTAAPPASSDEDERSLRLALTLFRNPATGVEVRYGPVAVHAGYYPTVIPRGGANRTTEFVRLGGAFFFRERGPSPYAAGSYLISLTDGWADSVLLEGGGLVPFARRFAVRLGVAVLVPTDGERVRLNPTVGASVRLF